MRLLTHNFLKSNVKGCVLSCSVLGARRADGLVSYLWPFGTLAHRMSVSHCPNRTENGYPLNIEVATVRCAEPSAVDKEFLLNLLPKVNYSALKKAAQQVAPHCDPPLPDLPGEIDVSDAEANAKLDDVVIANLYRVLFDVYLVEGFLVCPDTGRKFPVKECIPNMILHEDEI